MSRANVNAPFRFDIVGSFLRPEELKEARQKFERNEITKEELTIIEDKYIKELITKQKESGLQVITDGEFRRSWWHLDFMWGLKGVKKVLADKGYQFKTEETRAESAALTGKTSGENHPFVEHFKFVKLFEEDGIAARQTIPAPAQFLAELQRNTGEVPTNSIYPNEDELVEDIAKAYQRVILDLYAAGCRNVQLDDCTWGMFCDTNFWANIPNAEKARKNQSKLFIRVNNLAIANLPEDLVVTTHVCRGNYHSTWASSGGYAPIAEELFGNENVNAYYLEFDDERSGDFEPLKYVSGDKKVVLGLVTSKSPELEDKEFIKNRIKEATQFVPLDRLYLSPQCGFASTEEGNILTEGEQWKKIQLIKEIANEVWQYQIA